ncbi:enoyl Coenzyme A hydratase [Tieghemostelium lacteum]|uniref:Enoyl Coenzyme A hydratase n=1 Tax=Tieghemostelium lacteum TaxID=361077 RepID=A0A151ZI12_TIELA|nr:enoyl Coenzyme A hydratase [Tieghemostelium lacteum]|eukprot:KYQ93510.1 enoyl Coenzyme A hydratase [Tieghemostelium lacteum]
MESLVFSNNSPSSINIQVKNYEYIRLDKKENGVAELVLNRGKQLNTMNDDFFNEFISIFNEIQNDNAIRVVIVWAEGRMFSAGLNLVQVGPMLSGGNDSEKGEEDSLASNNLKVFRLVRRWQSSFDKINKCTKPVIAAIHNMCIGGAVDLVTACDIRLCSEDAVFSIKETQLAIVADLGTLQRIGRICGSGFAREIAFTGANIDSQSALRNKLVNHVYKTKEILLEEARKLATQISKNSPLVVQSTKIMLNHADDHTIDEGLLRVALHNSAFLKSDDLNEAVASFIEKRPPIYKSNL